MKEASVLICESEYLSRIGLKYIIDKNPFYQVTGEAASLDELEARLKQKEYDIITLDVSESGPFGFECISLVQEISPDTEILIISNEDNKRKVYDILARGINRYLTKCCQDAEIYNALNA